MDLLEIEIEGITIKEARDSAREKLNALEASIDVAEQTLRAKELGIQEAQIKKQNLEREIAETLKIQDYVGEKQTAITRLENRETSLQREFEQKRERLAVADTITNFLTRQSQYDFTVLYAHVQNIRHARERGFASWPGGLPRLEEKVRMLALQAFKGDLISTKQHRELMQKYENCERDKRELEKEVSELRAKYAETESNLEQVTREKQFLEVIQVNLDGRSTTLGELRNWIHSTYRQAIEREAAERSNAIAAATHGLLDFVVNKITGKSLNRRSRQQ